MGQKRLSEIKVVKPTQSVGVTLEQLQDLKNQADIFANEIYVDELKEVNYNPWKLLAEIDDLYEDVLRPFILEQMIFSNYELTKNGKRLLVTHNHQNFVSKSDIENYVDLNKDLRNYLNTLLFTYYKKEFDKDIAPAKIEYIRTVVSNDNAEWIKTLSRFEEVAYDYVSPIEDVLSSHLFIDYMNRELLKADLYRLTEGQLKKKIVQKLKPTPKDTKSIRVVKEIIAKTFIQLLREYPESKITQLLAKWGIKSGTPQERQARQLITRFEQIKGALESKAELLPSDIIDNIKDLKNIDLYTYEQLESLIQAYPESDEKIKKEAVRRFTEKDGIPREAAQSYVARFMNKRADLENAVKSGIRRDGETLYSREQVLTYIPKALQGGVKYLDPRSYPWEAFEQMLDALFPSERKVKDGEGGDEINTAESTGDKIYEKDGIEIYKCDDQSKCITYNPTVKDTGRKKYGWCVSTPGGSMYDRYRFEERAPTFYFIFDRNKSSEPDHPPFVDKWHAIALQVNKDGTSYIVTSAANDKDHVAPTWESISKIVPSETWNRIKGLQEYIEPVALSDTEVARKVMGGKNLSLEEFKGLTIENKRNYILAKGSKNELPDEILKILPLYKLSYEGRTTTLADIAIDSGQDFPYGLLKKYENLAKRYAIFRSRHTIHGKKPIPLPFVKYLDEAGKEKYLKTFDDNLTFEYIVEYFGEQAAKNYVDEQSKKFEYLPPSAVKYITDPNIKKIYTIYNKLTSEWIFGDNTNVSEDDLGSAKTMPLQKVHPVPVTLKQWQSLSPVERKVAVQLTKKYSGKSEYLTLLYALPIVVQDGQTDYVLVIPDTGNSSTMTVYTDWVLADMNGKAIEEVDGDAVQLNGMVLSFDSMYEPYERVISLKDLKNN